jgi:hypothetical protein
MALARCMSNNIIKCDEIVTETASIVEPDKKKAYDSQKGHLELGTIFARKLLRQKLLPKDF